MVPAQFLTAVGFKTVQPHPRYPLLRMELRSVLRWRGDVEVALERLARRHPAGEERGPVGASRGSTPRSLARPLTPARQLGDAELAQVGAPIAEMATSPSHSKHPPTRGFAWLTMRLHG